MRKESNLMIEKIGMTVGEAAGYTGIGRNTLRSLVNYGKLPVLRVGRKNIIRTDVLMKFLEENQGVNLLNLDEVRPIE